MENIEEDIMDHTIYDAFFRAAQELAEEKSASPAEYEKAMKRLIYLFITRI